MRFSFNWMHLKGRHHSFIAKYQHLHYSLIYTTLSLLFVARDSHFFPEDLFAKWELNSFKRLLLLFASGFSFRANLSHRICIFISSWDLYQVGERRPGFSGIQAPKSEWAGLTQQLRSLGPPTSSAVGEWDPRLTKLHIAACHRVWQSRVLFTKHCWSPPRLFLLETMWLTLPRTRARKW